MAQASPEILLYYPLAWEEEYKQTRFVQKWRDEYPKMFEYYKGSDKLGTRIMFAQYCLMYLLRSEHGVESITWYKIASSLTERSAKYDRTLHHWNLMRKWMGERAFTDLQETLRSKGFDNIKGEPDLFCWKPDTGEWFFAEAKYKDKIIDSEVQWYDICKEVLPEVEIRVCRVKPAKE